jgi:putative transposase
VRFVLTMRRRYTIADFKMPRAKTTGQLALDLPRPRPKRSWGGARKNAGRKKSSKDVPHVARPAVAKRFPNHVGLRVRKEVGRLRRGPIYRAIARALRQTLTQAGFRAVHTSIQHNHLHFLVEADDKAALSAGMRSLSITAALAINRVMGRRGQVFEYRYSAKPITSPRQMRNALAYVLNNWRRHQEHLRSEAAGRSRLDPYSTAILFDGWKETPQLAVRDDYEPLPAAAPTTWLLRVGWRRHGPISAYSVPGGL